MTEAQESEVGKLFDITRGDNDILTIGATVDTGLEWLAVDECKQKFDAGIRVVKERGKIYFNVAIDEFPKVQEMRSIDNIFIIGDVRKFPFLRENKDDDLALIKTATLNHMNLEKYLNAWKTVCGFPGKIYPTSDEWKFAVENYRVAEESVEEDSISSKGRKRGCDPSLAKDHSVLSYRITCERVGEHSFESSSVATAVGGELQDKYHWVVDLTKFHLEILCKVTQDEMVMNLRVTHQSKHRRNIVHFGPTTLRATVCYNLLKLAEPKTGDIIIDPMCGGGSIPIEAALAFPKTYVLCGDNHDKAVARTRLNVEASANRHKLDSLQWNATKLPFKDSQIDIVVTDMKWFMPKIAGIQLILDAAFIRKPTVSPFGKRSGSMSDNRVLYKSCLVELARVVKLTIGRLVLLTYDRRSISRALQSSKKLFSVSKMLAVNMGGLNAAAYVLKRSNLTYEQFAIKPSGKSHGIDAEKTIITED